MRHIFLLYGEPVNYLICKLDRNHKCAYMFCNTTNAR